MSVEREERPITSALILPIQFPCARRPREARGRAERERSAREQRERHETSSSVAQM